MNTQKNLMMLTIVIQQFMEFGPFLLPEAL